MVDRSARPRSRRALWLVGGLVGVAMIAVAGTVFALDRSVDRVDVEGLGETPSVDYVDDDDETADERAQTDPDLGETDVAPDALTVLVLGSDSREVLTSEERDELGTGDAWGERTETIALLRLDPDADEMRMLNVPRDTLITRCDGSRGRVNAAYAIGERNGVGGTTCIVETLREWIGIAIDHTVKVDFRGFVDIVDALDGVPMVLDEPISDQDANLDLEAGCTRLDGAEALAFVRARHIDDDFGRMARQQRLVEEVRRELASVGVFDELPRLLRTADAVARSVELDSSLTLNRIQRLARQHRDTLTAPIDGRAIPGVIQRDGIAFLEVEREDALEMARWLETGFDPDDEAAADGYDAAGTDGAASTGEDAPDDAASDQDTGASDTGETSNGDDAADDDRPAASDASTVPTC